MKKLRSKAAALAMTLALALTGCAGGTSTDGGSATTTQDEALQWRCTSHTFEYSYGPDEAGSEASGDTDKTESTYELDEHGCVIKQTDVSTYTYDGGSSVSTIVREFTRDENGWPLTQKVTDSSKSTYSYVDESGKTVQGESDEGSHESEVTYSYERDDKGRVTKAACSDGTSDQVEFAYDEAGNVVKTVRTTPLTSIDNVVKNTVVTQTFNAEGTLTGCEVVTKDEFGNVLATETSECDGEGQVTKTVTKRPQEKGDELVETREYAYEKSEDGKSLTQTVTVVGDGVTETLRYEGDETFREVLMPDGSIKACKMTIDSNGTMVSGEEATYEGPYSVTEKTFDDQGRETSSRCTYYDGTVSGTEATYDEAGNKVTNTTIAADGSTKTFENAYDENGNMTSSTLVSSTDTADVSTNLKNQAETFTWTHVDEPAPFISINEKFLHWFDV